MNVVCSEWHHIIEGCYKLCGIVNKGKEMFALIGNTYTLNFSSCTEEDCRKSDKEEVRLLVFVRQVYW